MDPMEAWRVISANLANFYRMRSSNSFKGYVDADIDAEVTAFKALQEMQERQDTKVSEKSNVKRDDTVGYKGYTRVEDGLPPVPGRYLCIWKGTDYPDGMEDVLNFSGEYWHIERAFAPGRFVVTHWMELPKRRFSN